MKKIVSFALLSILMAVPAMKAHAQEMEFTLTPRLEGTYNEADRFGWGASALYSFLEGQINDKLSFYVTNHWLCDGTKYLYKNTKLASENDWLDAAALVYAPGDWEFKLGKDYLALGSFEMQYDDVDCYDPLMSVMWNTLPVYQWGGSILYNLNDEHAVNFELASSPFQNHYFDEIFMTLGWNGTFGPLTNRWAASYDTSDIYMFTLGHRMDFSDRLYATLDFYNIVQDGAADVYDVVAAAKYAFSDKFTLGGSFGNINGDHRYGGLSAEYKPLAGSGSFCEELRLHAFASYNKVFTGDVDLPMVFGLGVTCPISFSK